jgi:protein-L-isoaspartate(D-aspartate) O-methyltransferase
MSHLAIIKSGVTLTPDFVAARAEMVEAQLRRRGIEDPRVLGAMLEIPREEFMPPEARLLAYRDDPIPIGHCQTISQPYMTALMAELLELSGTETVLEVGTGSGYAAAVLGALAARVVTIELIPALAKFARDNLARTGRDGNVVVVCGDGSFGYPPLAPFAAISVAAGAPDVPHTLLDQLRDPGCLVIPVGELHDQELRVVRKEDGSIKTHVATMCRFVPLLGGEGWGR